jgi:hypothetical protein
MIQKIKALVGFEKSRSKIAICLQQVIFGSLPLNDFMKG